MDKTSTPLSEQNLRGLTPDTIKPDLATSTNPGPTRDLRGIEPNTSRDKGKPFTTSDITEITYAPGFVVDPFKTFGGD